jgi:hypothetical protein
MSTAGANAADRPLIHPRAPARATGLRLHSRKERPVRTRHAAPANENHTCPSLEDRAAIMDLTSQMPTYGYGDR